MTQSISSHCITESSTPVITCKLTTPELRERKATIIAGIKKQILERKELTDGYAFRFAGHDQMLDKLIAFIKTERECCSFFTFRLSVSGDQEVWMELTGPGKAKEFILEELGL